jgi:hypothetical protein
VRVVLLSLLGSTGASTLNADNTQSKGGSPAPLSYIRLFTEKAPKGVRTPTTLSKNKKVLPTEPGFSSSLGNNKVLPPFPNVINRS